MHPRDVVQVQIGEQLFEFRNDLEVAGGFGQIQSVAAMARPFGDLHAGGAHGGKRFESCMDQQGIGIDAAFRLEFHQIRFQDDVAPAHVQWVHGQKAAHGVVEGLVVGRRLDRRNLGGSNQPCNVAAGQAQCRTAGGRRHPLAARDAFLPCPD